MYNPPHIANLRKRASALGLIITKTTTAQDAYIFGGHRYVLHVHNQNSDDMEDVSLHGIRGQIEELEQEGRATADPDKTLKAFCTSPKTIARGSRKGDGMYSSVYEGPMPGTVIKVGHKLTDGWLLYAAYCMTSSDPHTPNILAIHIDTERHEFHAIMEKLDTQDEYLKRTESVYKFSDKVSVCCDLYLAVARVPNELKTFVKGLAGWALARYGEKYSFFDAHEENWMYRKDQLVLTDPFSTTTDAGVEALRELSETMPNVVVV